MLVKSGTAVAYVAPLTPAGIAARELAHRWVLLPRSTPREAEAFMDDIAAARAAVPAPGDPWA